VAAPGAQEQRPGEGGGPARSAGLPDAGHFSPGAAPVPVHPQRLPGGAGRRQTAVAGAVRSGIRPSARVPDLAPSKRPDPTAPPGCRAV